jgi:hypothetical protein
MLEIGGSGRFVNQLHLFVDDRGLREFVLRVSGEAKARKDQQADPKP